MPAVTTERVHRRPPTYNPAATRQTADLANNAPPMFRVHPMLWEVAHIADAKGKSEPCLIPQISVDWDVPGVNGIRDTSNVGPDGLGYGRTSDPATARKPLIMRRSDQGFLYLDPDTPITEPEHLPPGAKPRTLVVRTPTSKGRGQAAGTHHHSAWQTVEPKFGGGHEVKAHHAPQARWLRDMARSDGLGLGPVPERWEHAERDRLQRRIDKVRAKQGDYTPGQYEAKLADRQARLNAFEAALKAQRAAEGRWK